jgi:putative ABC transport system substrate-binding protein
MPTVGFLSSRSEQESSKLVGSFLEGLGSLGFTEGENVRIVYRWADGHFDRLNALAIELSQDKPAVFAAMGGEFVVRAALAADKSVPIVFLTGTDPAQTGLVASLNRPGSNITGVTLYSVLLQQKRLELIHQLVPAATSVAVLLNPNNTSYGLTKRDSEAAVQSLKLKLEILDAGTASEIQTALNSLANTKNNALVVATDPLFSAQRHQIIAEASRLAIPAIFDSRVQVREGGLIGYGASYAETYRQAGIYTGRVLKGQSAADLPILLPSKFDLAINLKTAKELGIAVPHLGSRGRDH